EEFSYPDENNTLSSLKQAYVSYAVSDKVKLTAGKFGTHIGYELLDPQANKNYSMSYMFSYGPFSNTGIKADFDLGKLGLMIGVTNLTDEVRATTNVKSLVAQVSGGSEKVKAFLNYTGFFGSKTMEAGSESLSQLDLVVTGVVTDKFDI